MNLKAIAEHFANETFEAFNETTRRFELFDLTGRVSLVDRFQSIYNKPLRRRTLFHDSQYYFPESYTIRNVLTGATYLLGQTRLDGRADEGGAYHGVTVMHLVTEEPYGSAGLFEVHRRVPKGPPEDLGWLEDEVVAYHYGDTEFRTSKGEEGSFEVDIESYVAHFPRHADLRRNDYLVLGDRRLRVEVASPDSGFMLARADEEEDSRVNMVLHHQGVRTYDETLHRYVTNSKDYNFTGEVPSDYTMGTWLSDSASYIDVVVDQGHISVEPQEGDSISYQGYKRTIKRVEKHSSQRQYRMRCE